MNFLRNLFFRSKIPTQKPFPEYMLPGNSAYIYDFRFNVIWNSEFGAELIDSLKDKEPVYFEYAKQPRHDGEVIKVFNEDYKPFGWAPFRVETGNNIFIMEFIEQVSQNIMQTAYASAHGIVKSNPQYRWCEIKVDLQIPYPEDDEIVYCTQTGNLYHRFEQCNRYDKNSIPISIAKRCGLQPCTRCCDIKTV